MEKKNQKLYFTILSGLLVISAILGAAACIPEVREKVRELFYGQSRSVLAKVEGDFTGAGEKYLIVKVQTMDTLALEVYQYGSDENRPDFIRRLILPEKRDGYFNFRGQSTNLVLTDLDGDNVLEIVAPSFDENLIPRLNIFKFDKESKTFSRASADQFKL